MQISYPLLKALFFHISSSTIVSQVKHFWHVCTLWDSILSICFVSCSWNPTLYAKPTTPFKWKLLKLTEQCYPVVLFDYLIKQYKMFTNFSVCEKYANYSSKRCWEVTFLWYCLLCCTRYFKLIRVPGRNRKVRSFIWKGLCSTFLSYRFWTCEVVVTFEAPVWNPKMWFIKNESWLSSSASLWRCCCCSLLKDRQAVSCFHTTRTDIFKVFGWKFHYIQYLLVGSVCAMSYFPYLEMRNVKGSHE